MSSWVLLEDMLCGANYATARSQSHGPEVGCGETKASLDCSTCMLGMEQLCIWALTAVRDTP